MADADYDFGGGYAQERRAPPSGGTGTLAPRKLQRILNIAGGLSSLALVVGLGYWGYRLAVRDVSGVPVIQAMEGPMRIVPEDPGGEIMDHQGLAVNNVAEVGIAAPTPEKLILAPRPVELTDEDRAGLASGLSGQLMPGLESASAPVEALTGNSDLVLAAAPPTESQSPTEVAIDAALAEALGDVPVAETEPLVELSEEPAPEGAISVSIRPKARPGSRAAAAPAEMAAAVTAPAEAAAAVTAPTETAAAAAAVAAANEIDPATIVPGTRLVQFGTFDTAEEARAEWVRLQGRVGELLAEKGLVVQPAESGGRTFYRLRAYGFESEDDARRFCSAFVAQDLVCIPVPHK